jgi:hypothetical protein
MKTNLMLHQKEHELYADTMGESQGGRGTAGNCKNECAYAFTTQKEGMIE